ncbi:MAG: Cu(I)/Ag(I) efflux system membrane fusion protein, partial [Myxococcota bacterium]
EGEIAFIDPTVDSRLRTAKVRVQVDEPGTLRPGMFAEAVVTASDGASPLVIPATAPLFTGRRSIVYVERPSERGGFSYTPRTVRLGPRLGEVYPVVAGLSAGERVVTRGAFAIDADLQIRGGPSMMSTPDDTATEGAALVPLTPTQRASLAPTLSAYLEVQVTLADDDLPAAVQAAGAVVAAAAAVRLEGAAAAPWSEVSAHVKTHADALAKAGEIEAARAEFEPLSLAIEAVLRRFGNPLDAPVQVAFCPMARGSEGARWVQQGTDIDNAYFGASMLSCGEITAAVDPGTYLAEPTEPADTTSHDGHDH